MEFLVFGFIAVVFVVIVVGSLVAFLAHGVVFATILRRIIRASETPTNSREDQATAPSHCSSCGAVLDSDPCAYCGTSHAR